MAPHTEISHYEDFYQKLWITSAFARVCELTDTHSVKATLGKNKARG